MKARNDVENRQLKHVKEFEYITTLKMAYRKHCVGDDSIGWDELGERLLDTLSNCLGIDKMNEWLDSLSEEVER